MSSQNERHNDDESPLILLNAKRWSLWFLAFAVALTVVFALTMSDVFVAAYGTG